MALAVGSYVSHIRADSAATGLLLDGFRGGRPLFGRICADNQGGNWDVIWEDGSVVAVDGAMLDQIVTQSISPDVVRVENDDEDTVSSYYDCLVAAKYQRLKGGTASTGNYVLLKCLNVPGQYLEISEGFYQVLEDR